MSAAATSRMWSVQIPSVGRPAKDDRVGELDDQVADEGVADVDRHLGLGQDGGLGDRDGAGDAGCFGIGDGQAAGGQVGGGLDHGRGGGGGTAGPPTRNRITWPGALMSLMTRPEPERSQRREEGLVESDTTTPAWAG